MAESSVSFHKVLSEAKRIINLHRHHFFSLSALFLFPLSLLSLLYLTAIRNKPNPNPYLTLLPQLLYTLFSSLLSLFSAATVLYSTYHAWHGEPVDLLTSLKSIKHSFWPLFSTSIVTGLIVYLITIPLLLSVFALYKWLHNTSLLTPCLILIGVVFGVALIHLSLSWMLASSIVVVEYKWGYEPLKRSASLMKGNKRVALLFLLYIQLVNGLIFLMFYLNGSERSDNTTGWCLFVFLILLGSFCLSQIMLLGYVVMAVMYIYCSEASQEGLPILCPNPDKLVHLFS